MINEEEAVKFGVDHLQQKENERVERKAWIDDTSALMLVSDRSDIVNALSNFEVVDFDRAERTEKAIRELTTTKAFFDVSYFKDILKLITKLKISSRVRVSMGNNSPLIIEMDDKSGGITIMLAPLDMGEQAEI